MEVEQVEEEMNMFTSIFNTSQFKKGAGFRLGGYVMGLWGASLPDVILAFIVNAALRKEGTGVCFYSCLGGIHIGSGRHPLEGWFVAGTNIYDKYREKDDKDDVESANADLRHVGGLVVGFLAGKFMPKYFGKSNWAF